MLTKAKNARDIEAERLKTLDAAEDVLATAEAEGRDLTPDESSRLKELHAKAETLADERNDRAAFEHARDDVRRQRTEASGSVPFGASYGGGKIPLGPLPTGGQSQPRRSEFVDAATGSPLNVLRPDESLAAAQRPAYGDSGRRLGVGDTVLQMVTGRGGSAAYNANISGSDSSGGYLTTPTFANEILDLARSASVVNRGGASTVSMTSNELHMARQTSDPTGYWRREGEAITASEASFDRVTLRPRVLAALCTLTVELVQDASNAAAQIERSMAAALGLALDQAALFGTGAEANPLGIVNTVGVNSETSVGTPDDYAEVTSAIRQILTANYPGEVEGLAWLGHPRDFATFDGLTDTTGQPLQPTPWASRLRPLPTTSFSTTEGGGENESTMIVGDLSQVVFGMRTEGVRLEVFNAGSALDVNDVSHNAVTEMKLHLRAYMRADVAVMRPSWITKLTGVTAT